MNKGCGSDTFHWGNENLTRSWAQMHILWYVQSHFECYASGRLMYVLVKESFDSCSYHRRKERERHAQLWRGNHSELLLESSCCSFSLQMPCNNDLSCVLDATSKSIVKQVKDFLQESWSEVFDSLIQSGSLDIVRRLVLGPPYAEPERRSAFSIIKSAAFAMISQPFAGRTDSVEHLDGWEYADRYSEGTQQQVIVWSSQYSSGYLWVLFSGFK